MPQLVVSYGLLHDQLQQPLDGPQPPRQAGHVVQQQQPAAGAQDALYLSNGAPLVGDGAQRQGADHRVEGGIGQLQRLGVPKTQVHPAAQLVGLASGQL